VACASDDGAGRRLDARIARSDRDRLRRPRRRSDVDDHLAELFLSGTAPVNVTLQAAIRRATVAQKIVPVLMGTALRNKGIYLALTTFAGQYIILWVLYLPVLDPWTKTVKGYLMPEPSVLGLAVPYARRDLFFYYFLLLCGAGAILFVKNLLRSRIGRALLAVRDNDIVAEMLGVNIFAYKLMAFGVSAFYAGFTGALFGYYAESILPEHFNIFVSINYVFMVVIGGIGRLWGPVLGAVIVLMIPEGLRLLTGYVSTILPAYVVYTEQAKLVVFGLIVIVLLIAEPRGVIAIWDKVKNYFRAWPYRYV